MKKTVIIATILAAFSAAPAFADADQKRIVGKVQRILDGDTFTIAGTDIRIWGIDAPELKQQCRDIRSKPYSCGIEAKANLARIIRGRVVACHQRGTDRKRIVAECRVDGEDIGRAMVLSGHAVDASKYSNRTYAAVQRKAMRAEVGLWRGSFQEPWQWRKANRN